MTGPDPWRFDYRPSSLRVGRGAAGTLADELERHGYDRALVVCGQTVGQTDAVINPVSAGLGDHLAGVFAETTPEKRIGTALAGLEAVAEHEADVLVGLGGGSSLDITKQIAALSAREAPETAAAELERTGTFAIPDGALLPIVAVPTTLAGADLSMGAGVAAEPGGGLVDAPTSGGISDPRLMPAAVVADPALVATTPRSILVGSAMNGFDKGIETVYARSATPVTDATATHGLSLLGEALPGLGSEPVTAKLLDPIVAGLVLVQYGVSRPDAGTLSLIHAFGHALRRHAGLQQGIAHAVVAPHALAYLFEQVDARRALLADALGVGDRADPAVAVVDQVREIRDTMGLPGRLRDVDGPPPDTFLAVAADVLDDSLLPNAPPGLEPTAGDIEGVLRAAH